MTPRAEAYLATFTRHTAPSVEAAAAALRRAGCPELPVWLDFHARYAGYEEVILNEVAVWGLIHPEPTWLEANNVSTEREGDAWLVACADVHPAYDYWLDQQGQLVRTSGNCSSFDVKVERDAVFHETCAGRRWMLDVELSETVHDIAAAQRLVPDLTMVSEASDRYATCWRAADVIVDERDGRLTFTVAREASERLRAAAARLKEGI